MKMSTTTTSYFVLSTNPSPGSGCTSLIRSAPSYMQIRIISNITARSSVFCTTAPLHAPAQDMCEHLVLERSQAQQTRQQEQQALQSAHQAALQEREAARQRECEAAAILEAQLQSCRADLQVLREEQAKGAMHLAVRQQEAQALQEQVCA